MNEKDIKALHWKKDQRIALGNGLYLYVRKASKTYVFRKRVKGKASITTLGKHPVLSLRDAKSQAQKLSEADDINTATVSQLKSKYWEKIVEPKSKVPNQVEGYLNHIENEFGRVKVRDIKKPKLVKFIEDYSEQHGTRSADRLRSYLKQIFAYAVELGWLNSSPMAEVTKRITGYIAIDRTRTLTVNEIKMLWNWKNNKQGWQKTEENVKVIKFLLLSGLRISEAQSGYQDGNYFRVDDTKGKHSKAEKRPHWIYLTDTAKSLLPLPSCTATNIQAWLKRKLISEGYTNKIDRYTPHDCRRSFVTIANSIGVLPHIVEKCVNHKLEGMMAVYNQSEYEDERIACFKAVEAKILEIVK